MSRLSLLPLSGQQVTIGVLRDFESRLRYANGNCSWRLTVPGTADDVPVDTSPEILVRGADTTNGIIWKCFVEDILQLHAIFAVYGNITNYCAVSI